MKFRGCVAMDAGPWRRPRKNRTKSNESGRDTLPNLQSIGSDVTTIMHDLTRDQHSMPHAEPQTAGKVAPSISAKASRATTVASRLGPPASAARRAWAADFGRLLAADTDHLVALAFEEIGKPEWETVAAEILPTVASCRWHARRSRRVLADRRLRDRPWWLLGQSSMTRRMPLGRVGIIATWNYPIQLLGVQLVQAVVGGNRVIVKPSERTPKTQSRILELARHAGLDEHELDIRSADRESGAAMLEEPELDHVVFTGSTAVGRHVAIACAERLVPSTLELSGCDSVVVMADADPVVAARAAWAGLMVNHGQTCMAPRRILVHESIASDFTAAIVPLAATAPLRRLADRDAAVRHRHLVADAVSRGARLAALVDDDRDDDVVRAQIAIDCPVDAEAFSADHFGPLVVTTTWSTREQLIDLHRRGGKHLATSVFTGDPRTVDTLVAELGGGLVTINDTIIPFAHPASTLAPFADSGWGASQGIEGLLSMTRPVVVSRTGRIRIPSGEPDEKAKSMLRRLVAFQGRGIEAPPVEDQNRTTTPGDSGDFQES